MGRSHLGSLQSRILDAITASERPLVSGEILRVLGQARTPATSAALSRALRRLTERGYIDRLSTKAPRAGSGYIYALRDSCPSTAKADVMQMMSGHASIFSSVGKAPESAGDAVTRDQAAAAIAAAIYTAQEVFWRACDAEGRAIDPADLDAPAGLLDAPHELALQVETLAIERDISWVKARTLL